MSVRDNDLTFNLPSSVSTDLHLNYSEKIITLKTYNEAVEFYNAGELSAYQLKFIFEQSEFDNSFFPVDFEISKKDLPIPYSEEYMFFNDRNEWERVDLTFSNGIFPYETSFALLMDDNITFEDIEATLENEAATYYWFDNSVPIFDMYFQNRVIPWGKEENRLQFSYHFPTYSLNFETNISGVNTQTETNFETSIWPREDIDEINNLEFDTRFSSFAVNFQWALGKEMKTTFNLEYERLLGTNYLTQLEFANIVQSETKTQLEYSAGWASIEHLNFEYDAYISGLGVLPLEWQKNIETFDNIQLEWNYDASLGRNYIQHFEWLGIADKDRPLDFEYERVYHDFTTLEMEWWRVRHSEEPINLETYISSTQDYVTNIEAQVSTVSKSLNMEFSRIYNEPYSLDIETEVPFINSLSAIDIEVDVNDIWKDIVLNLEWHRVYHTQDLTDLEYDITGVTKKYITNFETVLSTDMDASIDIEFLRPKESRVLLQHRVIPWNYKTQNIQFYHTATQYENVNIEYDVTVNSFEQLNIESGIIIIEDIEVVNLEADVKNIWNNGITNFEIDIPNLWQERELPIEFKFVFHDLDNIDIEFDLSIRKDYIQNLETDISINKAYELTLEYVQKISDNYSLDLETEVVINDEAQLQIEYIIDRLTHDFELPLEYFISPTQNFALDLELFVGTVSKSLNLEIDVLDLVYYFIRKGHNILPWSYSDGKGNWDNTVNKNWNKLNPDETKFLDGFVNQVTDKGLTVPDIVSFSDNKLENWGTIIKGVQDMNPSLSDKFLYYKSIDDEHILVMGKRKRDPIEVVHLKEGENLIIWDGAFKASEPPMFNEKIKPEIESFIDNVQVWDQRIGEWKTLIGNIDHPLYFEHIVDGSLQPMPFIINIKVTADCSFTITR